MIDMIMHVPKIFYYIPKFDALIDLSFKFSFLMKPLIIAIAGLYSYGVLSKWGSFNLYLT